MISSFVSGLIGWIAFSEVLWMARSLNLDQWCRLHFIRSVSDIYAGVAADNEVHQSNHPKQT